MYVAKISRERERESEMKNRSDKSSNDSALVAQMSSWRFVETDSMRTSAENLPQFELLFRPTKYSDWKIYHWIQSAHSSQAVISAVHKCISNAGNDVRSTDSHWRASPIVSSSEDLLKFGSNETSTKRLTTIRPCPRVGTARLVPCWRVFILFTSRKVSKSPRDGRRMVFRTRKSALAREEELLAKPPRTRSQRESMHSPDASLRNSTLAEIYPPQNFGPRRAYGWQPSETKNSQT